VVEETSSGLLPRAHEGGPCVRTLPSSRARPPLLGAPTGARLGAEWQRV